MTAARELPFLAAGGEMGGLIAEFGWDATSLGPIGSWPAVLRTSVGIMLGSRNPMILWWGPGFTTLYNDAFRVLAGDRHPEALGRRGEEMCGEIWPAIGPMLAGVREHGTAGWLDDQLLLLDRTGVPEETYWTYSSSAVRGDDGRILGVVTAADDTTGRVLAERRLETLRRLASPAERAATPEQAAVSALDSLASAAADVPFAAVCFGSVGNAVRPAAAYGVDAIAPVDAHDIDAVLRSREPALVDGRLVSPLACPDGDPPGVVVLGLSPHRPLDGAYRAFLDLVAGQVSVAVDDARARAAARRRHEAQAELERARTAFFARSGHEFDAPAPAPGVRRVLQVVRRQGLRLSQLVDSLLDRHDTPDGQGTRRDAATEPAGHQAPEVAAARLRAMVEGLAAIVWEADWMPPTDPDGRGELRLTFVSDRVEELLGHPAAQLVREPERWWLLIHPDDRAEAVATFRTRTAAGLDHDLICRETAVDGRVVWLHHVVHVATDARGAPLRAHGVAIDVTVQQRAEHSTAVLADIGRLVADDGGGAEERLGALARLVRPVLGDGVVVSLAGPDGTLRRAAVVHEDPAVERAILALGPNRLAASRLAPTALAELRAGRPVVVTFTDAMLREMAHDEDDAAARIALGVTSALVVPLLADRRLIGLLGFVNVGRRHYDEPDLELATELGRRTSLMLARDRTRRRERDMQQVSADLASADGVAEAAQRLVTRVGEILGTTAVSVYLVEPERGIRMVHATGYSAALLAGYALVRFDDDVPLAQAVRTGEPIWITDRDDWHRRWPELLPHAVGAGRHAAATIPLVSGGAVVGTIGVSFDTPREFPEDERQFVRALVAQAAPAFERAAVADERRAIADTLQTSLLPLTLPELDRLALAARYLPGAQGTRAGGDWYDVLPLDGDRVAIAVGDVVGQGARAASIMGQLRSALSGYLLEGHEPVRALEHLDRFAGRVPGAAGSTVACLVLDVGSGDLEWASAGHLPPLVVGPAGARYLDGARGTVLAVRGRPPFVAGRARLVAGESVVLYTDGLVERRDEIIDDGLDRLAAAAGAAHELHPGRLTEALLAAAAGPVPGGTALDDIAVIVARRVPPPLRFDLPAEARRLRRVRADVTVWACETGLSEDERYDLQLALGEATANAVEHAYRDRPGRMRIELVRRGDGRVQGIVRDWGDWRPAPADKGYRGRGMELIREVTDRMAVHHGPDGTEVSFELAAPAMRTPTAPSNPHPDQASTALLTGPPPPGPADPARIVVTGSPGYRHARVAGDLDLAGVAAVRATLQDAAADRSGGVPPELTIDLTAVTYLASTGVALLVEIARTLAPARRLRLLVPAEGVVGRVLALSDLDLVVDVVETPRPLAVARPAAG